MMVDIMDNVDLAFRYTQDDYVQAMRAHYASRLRLPLDIAVVIGMAGLGVYELRSASYTLGIVMLITSGVFTLMLVAAFFVIPIVSFRSQPKLRDEYALAFSPSGIRFRTAHIHSDLHWSIYTRALVTAQSFVLYYGSQQFTVIPKRVFQSEAERHAFERLLSQNVLKIIDKTK
jgi:hypothetical protein